MIIDKLNSCRIPEGSGVSRIPPRPVPDRQDSYDQLFDSDTIFYDGFRSAESNKASMIGPPLLNLQSSAFSIASAHRDREGRTSGQIVLNHPLYSRVDVDLQGEVSFLSINGDFGRVNLELGENLSSMFKDKRVLMTASKNNKLTWIQDWAHFNREEHLADAVLLYDNGSTDYGLRDIETAIQSISGIDVVVIVRWPFKWGPSGQNNRWDSNFAQIGAFEHARSRFLTKAKSVLNTDIDELVLTTTGRSIFEEAEISECGYVSFPGFWIENYVFDNDLVWDDRRYTDFVMLDGGIYNCPRKWVVVPSKCPIVYPWEPHRIPGMSDNYQQAHLAIYRHFRGISNGWKYQRDDVKCLGAGARESDLKMSDAMQRIFKTRTI